MEPKFLMAEEQESMSAAFRSAKPKERLEAAREYVACLERTATTLRAEVAEQTENNEIRSKTLQTLGAEVDVARNTIQQLEAKVRELETELANAKKQHATTASAMMAKDARIAELEGEAERQRQRAEDALLGSVPAATQPQQPINIGRSQHDKTPVPAGKWNAPRGTY